MSLYDKASIALIPSGYKASTLYSVMPANGNGDFDHSRSNTTATRVNKDGLIEDVTSNIPRLDYPLTNGLVGDCPHLLLEPQRTNFGHYSEQISLWSQAKVSTSDNQTISPDGSQNASKTTVTATFGTHPIYRTQYGTVTSGADYVMSIFVKKSTTKYIRFTEGYSNYGLIFNFDTEEITENGNASSSDIGVEKYPNDWYRLSVKFVGSSTTNSQPAIYLRRDVDSAESYTGTDEAVFVWGSQMEAGTYHTSYLKNLSTGSTTRSADLCNDSGTSAEFNDSEGVLFAEIASFDTNVGNARIGIAKASAGQLERVGFGFSTTTNQIQAFISRSATQVNILATISDIRDFNKIAFKYKVDDFSLFINGTKVGTDTSGSVPIGLDELSFDDNSGVIFYGKCKQLMVFNEALSDSELATLTS